MRAWRASDWQANRAQTRRTHFSRRKARRRRTCGKLETRNTLLDAERRGRHSAVGVNERLDALKGLPIRTDDEPSFQSAFELARTYGLSFYDALHLEPAKRESVELATLDEALAKAAAAAGVGLAVA